MFSTLLISYPMIYIYKYNQIEIYPLRTVAKLECGSTLKKCFFTKMRSFLLSSDLCHGQISNSVSKNRYIFSETESEYKIV